MSDIDAIIESVLSDEKLAGSKSCRDKIYSDQPLLKRGSQIKTPDVPRKITEMKALAYSPEAYWKTSAWLFYTQGKFMEDFEDVYEYSEPICLDMPTYNSLSAEQLRGFFSWRARFRSGQLSPAPLAFGYLLAFEIINGIGVKGCHDGFEMLLKLQENFRGRQFDRRISRWIADYAVYYGLDSECYEKCTEFLFDGYLIKAINCHKTADDELFTALSALGGEDGKVPFDDDNGDYYRAAVVRSFRGYSEFFTLHRKHSLCRKFYGRMSCFNYIPFNSAIFYTKNESREPRTVKVNELRSYTFSFGLWSCTAYKDIRGKQEVMGGFLAAVRYLVHEHLGCEGDGDDAPRIPNELKKIVKNVLEELDREKKLRDAMNVKIDLSRLSAIRADADITRDKLLTEEDMAEDDPAENYTENNAESTAKAEEKAAEDLVENDPPNALLDDNERAFLTALLNDGDAAAALRGTGVLLSVAADSVNDKLFDLFGDTVIEFDSDIPGVIEDYRDELATLINNGEI